MHAQWQIRYTYSDNISIDEVGPRVYPELGVTVIVENGVLKELLHLMSFDDDASESVAIARSANQLAAIFAALRYWRLKPLTYWVTAKRTVPPEIGFKLGMRASFTTLRHVRTPQINWNVDAPLQLTTWLILASEAQESPSAAAAIRFYFVILEDLKECNELPISPDEYRELKAIRDFVSHPQINGANTKSTLQSCAPGLANASGNFVQNPLSCEHDAILDLWRQKAKTFVVDFIARWVPHD
jgi:hypothetical protein